MSDCSCEAKGKVCFGCDADYLDILNNDFSYYQYRKECETLKKYREGLKNEIS